MIGKFIETEQRLVIAQVIWREEQGMTVNGYGVYFGDDETVLMLVMIVVTAISIY